MTPQHQTSVFKIQETSQYRQFQDTSIPVSSGVSVSVGGGRQWLEEINGTCMCVVWVALQEARDENHIWITLNSTYYTLYTLLFTVTLWARSLGFHFIDRIRWGWELGINFSKLQQGGEPGTETRSTDAKFCGFLTPQGLPFPLWIKTRKAGCNQEGKGRGRVDVWVNPALPILTRDFSAIPLTYKKNYIC